MSFLFFKGKGLPAGKELSCFWLTHAVLAKFLLHAKHYGYRRECRSCLLLSGELSEGLAGSWQCFLRGFGGAFALCTPELQGSPRRNRSLLVTTRMQKWSNKMAWWVKVLTTKPDNLSLLLSPHGGRREPIFLQVVF